MAINSCALEKQMLSKPGIIFHRRSREKELSAKMRATLCNNKTIELLTVVHFWCISARQSRISRTPFA
jgi:hypothetical protein